MPEPLRLQAHTIGRDSDSAALGVVSRPDHVPIGTAPLHAKEVVGNLNFQFGTRLISSQVAGID
jgi:hypothetical protein